MDAASAVQRRGGRPLIIGGMHRSGTSLTASLIASAGVNLGDELLGSLPGNDLGHFEDVGFLDFHQLALRTLGLGTEGYTTEPPGSIPSSLEPLARQLITERQRAVRPWGWKEPRTTLFLDFWQKLVPDARYLFVFRRPEDVLDSLLRRGDIAFAHNPRLGLAVWVNYNRLIRDFVRSYPASCMLLEISQVIADPADLMGRIRSRFDIDIGEPAPLFRRDCFLTSSDESRAEVARSLVPEVEDVYADLCRHADMPAASTADGPPALECAVLQWGRAARAETELASLRTELTTVQADAAALQCRFADAEARVRRLEHEALQSATERLRLGQLLEQAAEQGRHDANERGRLEEATRLATEALRAAEVSAMALATELATLEEARQALTTRLTAAAAEIQLLETDGAQARRHVERLEAAVREEQEHRCVLENRVNDLLAELAAMRSRTLAARLQRFEAKVRRRCSFVTTDVRTPPASGVAALANSSLLSQGELP